MVKLKIRTRNVCYAERKDYVRKLLHVANQSLANGRIEIRLWYESEQSRDLQYTIRLNVPSRELLARTEEAKLDHLCEVLVALLDHREILNARAAH